MSKKLKLQEVLQSLSKEELIDIIEEAARDDKVLERRIIVAYGGYEGQQELHQFKKLLQAIVKQYQGRHGFIEYRQVGGFSNELLLLLNKAAATTNVLAAQTMTMLILEEAVEAFQYADDSNGEVGAVVQEAIHALGDLTERRESLSIAAQYAMFDKLMVMCASKVFDDWDEFRLELLTISARFCGDQVLREKLNAELLKWASVWKKGDYSSYAYEHVLRLQYEVIGRYESEEAAERMLQSHLRLPIFREIAIAQAFEQKRYDYALQLASDGERKDRKLPGLVTKWKTLRYEAYRNLSMAREQRQLARELLLEGDFNYYHELKALTQEDRQVVYRELKEELRHSRDCTKARLYVKLILEEDDMEALLEHTRSHVSEIEEHAAKLARMYKPEVLEIYHSHILKQASLTSNRKEYKKVTNLIKAFKAYAGQEGMERVVNELSGRYSSRPAFLDELGKLK